MSVTLERARKAFLTAQDALIAWHESESGDPARDAWKWVEESRSYAVNALGKLLEELTLERIDVTFLARNIINQIGDIYHEKIPSDQWVPVRQATNDELDDFVISLITRYLLTDRFSATLRQIGKEAERSIEKHGEQTDLPDGTGPETYPLETYKDLGPHPEGETVVYSQGLRPGGFAQYIAHQATLDTKAHSRNEGGDGTITWWHILREEVFEASAEENPVGLREELVQVAAVALKWIDAIDQRSIDEPAG